MYVWKSKNRRDRRHFATSGLKTLDPADLAILRKNEVEIRKEEEEHRYELEQIEVQKFIRFAREGIETYFETRYGKDEVSAVGAILMNDRAEEEKKKKEAQGHDEGERARSDELPFYVHTCISGLAPHKSDLTSRHPTS